MDDPAVIRAVLREHGIEVPDRGRISAEHVAEFERIRAGEHVTADDPGASDEPGYAPPREETQPRRPRGPSVRARAKGWRDRAGQQRKPRAGRKKVKHPRVKVDDLIATGWEMMGRITQPVSLPVSRTFQLQAPVAGLVLEDAVRGTIVDRVLQPLARTQARGKAFAALAGPPLIVGAIERAQGIRDDTERAFRLGILSTALEECMLLWQDVAGDRFEEAAERMAERNRDREDVRKLINLVIFAPPEPPPADPDDEAAARAQQMAGV